jgi:hypothetical protein
MRITISNRPGSLDATDTMTTPQVDGVQPPRGAALSAVVDARGVAAATAVRGAVDGFSAGDCFCAAGFGAIDGLAVSGPGGDAEVTGATGFDATTVESCFGLVSVVGVDDFVADEAGGDVDASGDDAGGGEAGAEDGVVVGEDGVFAGGEDDDPVDGADAATPPSLTDEAGADAFGACVGAGVVAAAGLDGAAATTVGLSSLADVPSAGPLDILCQITMPTIATAAMAPMATNAKPRRRSSRDFGGAASSEEASDGNTPAREASRAGVLPEAFGAVGAAAQDGNSARGAGFSPAFALRGGR